MQQDRKRKEKGGAKAWQVKICLPVSLPRSKGEEIAKKEVLKISCLRQETCQEADIDSVEEQGFRILSLGKHSCIKGCPTFALSGI
jgi:hypothetical protein